jgi:DNA repair exonuclease SbcCD ATPase subunit
METQSLTVKEFVKKVKEVEGFDVDVWDQKVQAAGNSRIKVKLSKKRSPNSWTSSKWIEERISQESLNKFAFSVRWGDRKSKPQSGTLIETIRDSYPTSFASDARDAAQVKKEKEDSIDKLQIELEKLQEKVTRERKEHFRLKAENKSLETAAIDLARQLKRERKEHARLKEKNESLEAASIDRARQLEEMTKQLEEKSKLAGMNATQIDKKATIEGKKRAKDEAREALEDAFSNLRNPFEGLRDSLHKILDMDDFDAKSLVATLVSILNAAKWDVDKYMRENQDLRK